MQTKEAAKKKVRVTAPKDAKALKKSSALEIITHCEVVGIDSKILSSCLAVNPKTIQRWREGIAEPGESALRSLEKLETVYQLAARLLRKDSWKAGNLFIVYGIEAGFRGLIVPSATSAGDNLIIFENNLGKGCLIEIEDISSH